LHNHVIVAFWDEVAPQTPARYQDGRHQQGTPNQISFTCLLRTSEVFSSSVQKL
jgi:hypothetical protein